MASYTNYKGKNYDKYRYIAYDIGGGNTFEYAADQNVSLADAQAEALKEAEWYAKKYGGGSTPTLLGQKVETQTRSKGQKSTTYDYVPLSEDPGRREVDVRTSEDLAYEKEKGIGEGNVQPGTRVAGGYVQNDGSVGSSEPTTRNPGESVADFTKRIDTGIITDPVTGNQYTLGSGGTYVPYTGQSSASLKPSSGAPSGVITDNVTGNQYTLGPDGTYIPYKGQTPSGVTPSTSGGVSSPSSGTPYTPPEYNPPVGTSFSERYKDLQKELELGKPPTAPDTFTNEDKARLTTARDERAALEDEMATINDERMQIEDEFKLYSDQQVGLPEAGRQGAISEKGRELQRTLDSLNRRAILVETKLSNRNTVISELMGLQRQEYEDALQSYESNYNRALQAYDLFSQEDSKIKRNATANLSVLSNAYQAQIESGQITQLSGMQRAKLEELEVQAGLPIGSTMAVLSTLKPSEEKLHTSFNEKTGQLQYFYRDSSGNIGVRTSQGSPTSSPDDTSTVGADLNDAFVAIQSGADPIVVKRAFLADHPSSNSSWDSFFKNIEDEVEYPEPEEEEKEKTGLFGWGFLGL